MGELTRVRLTTNDDPDYRAGYWIVEVFSVPLGRWIVQGYHNTKEAAEKDQQYFQ